MEEVSPRREVVEEEFDLRQYLLVLQRWWWLIVGCTLLAAIVAFAVSSRMQPVYQTAATLLVQQPLPAGLSENTAILTSERLVQIYARMLTSRPVLKATIARMGLSETPEELANRVKVEWVQNTQLIQVRVEDTDPARAAALANALAETFIEQVQATQEQRYAEGLNNLKTQIDELAAAIEKTQKELETRANDPTPQGQAERIRLETILAGYRNIYASLIQSYEQMRLMATQSRDMVVLFEPAQAPREPVRPRKLENTVRAGVLGALLAVGAVFLRERLDNTLKTPDDVNRVLGLPTLGAISRLEKGQKELVLTADPLASASEAFRVLRTNIRYCSVDRPLQVILVTSPTMLEGKSVVAANLAVALAQAGLRTVLLDADLRHPRQHQLFGLHPREGLTGALLAGSVDGRLQPTEVERLSLLPAGKKPPNPVELLGSQRMREIREELCQSFDAVVIDSPPVLLGADVAVLAQIADGVLLVVAAGETRRDAARQAVESLRQVRANVIGVVLNRVPIRPGGYYYYYSSSHQRRAVAKSWMGKRRPS
ncbi:polysaccharide biosynthesis tyrosine autokinase [Thermoflexus sp.]|uniref:polysaccharide biosynthesis tyrosine autokinase n=1 Tax=Thermoflexus sp. TaxID=1969742 RepID=UPI0035E43958